MAGGVVSSISRMGTIEPFDLQVARGQITMHKVTYRFGYNADVDTAEETIWSAGGLYAYLAAASVLKISSSSANDTAAGTGARTITISGLNANYTEVTETVILNGQTSVDTVNSYIRVFRLYVLTAGSGGTAAGDIYAGTGTVTAGVPAVTYLKAVLGDNTSQACTWTVPAGYTAFMTDSFANIGTAGANQYVDVRLIAREFGGVFRTIGKVSLQNGSASFGDSPLPLGFTEKTDIEVRATGSAVNNSVTAHLSFIYIKNDSQTA